MSTDTSEPTYVQRVMAALNEASPDLDPDLARLYALLVFVRGGDTTLEDVHDAWALWRNETKPDHKSIVPFGQLTHEVRELDRPYVDAILATVRATNCLCTEDESCDEHAYLDA